MEDPKSPTPPQEKRSYEKPVIKSLGKVRELTFGSTPSGFVDAVPGHFQPVKMP